MKVTLRNPSEVLKNLIAKWLVNEGYTLTCISSTCSCMSHDSGFGWSEYEFPDSVWAYVEKRIKHFHGSPSSHASCGWNQGPLERDLQDRGERATESAREIVYLESEALKHAKYLGDYSVIKKLQELAWHALGGQTEFYQLAQELRARAETKRQAEWAKKFAARDGVTFPLSGNGWRFIPA